MPLNLKPLHALYQLYNLHEGADLPHPLLILAQLSKKRSSSSDTNGELEWVVAVGGKDPNYKPEQKTGRQRRDANADDEWWGARMSAADVEELVSGVKGSAKTPQQTVDGIKSSWAAGDLVLKGYGVVAERRVAIELVVKVTDSLHIPIVLEPCDTAPLSTLTLLAEIIPPFLSCTADRASCSSATLELAALKAKTLKQEGEIKRYKEDERALKRRRTGAGGSFSFSQSQSQSQGGSQGQGQEGRGESVSPSKIPGQTHRGALRPGDPGYAGNASRPGRILEEDKFDTASESDSD